MNNPITYNDPDGDIAPLLVAAIVIGGGIINTASNWSNINSFGEGLNYFVTGAAGYGVATVNPALGAGILAGGNLLTKGVHGDLQAINSVADVLDITTSVALDFTAAYGVGSVMQGFSAFNAGGYLSSAEIASLAKEGVSVSTRAAGGIGLKTVTTQQVASAATAQAANQTIKQGAKQLLLQAPKTIAKHHIFPQQFRSWFSSRGISNIDDFTVPIEHWSTHLKGVHGKGLRNMPGRWNQGWQDFITKNPNASPSQIFKHGEDMLHRFGFEFLRYGPY